MANFVAYTTRLENRNCPTLHVLGTYAAGGFDYVNLKDSTPLPFYQGEDVDGLYGSVAPDMISHTPAGSGVSFSYYPQFQLVGVQISYIGFSNSDGTGMTQIRGDALSNYVEKTEYRYLQNGHIAIMVYFLEESIAAIRGGDPSSRFIVGANALLQAGNSLVTPSDEYEFDAKAKRKVPFSLAGVYQYGGCQNPTIDVSHYIYGSEDDSVRQLGNHIVVKDIGNDNVSKSLIFNSVRTQSWTFGSFNPDNQAPLYNDSYQDADYEDAFNKFWPCMYEGGFDTTRSRITAMTAGAILSNNGGVTNDQYPDAWIHLSSATANNKTSGRVFDRRELHGSTSTYLNQPEGPAKYVWGRFAGPMSRGGSARFDSNAECFVQDHPYNWPTVPSGGASGYFYDTSFTSYTNGSEGPPSVDANGNKTGGGSQLYLNGKSRNPYYPEKGSAFSHYVTFYKFEGSGTSTLNESDYSPSPSSTTYSPLSTGASGWTGYMADLWRKSLDLTDNQESTFNQFATKPVFGESQSDSAYRRCLNGTYAWTDFVAQTMGDTTCPSKVNGTASLLANYIDSKGIGNIREKDLKFSGLFSPIAKINEVSAISQGTGYPLFSGSVANAVDSPNSNQLQSDFRGGTMFSYTVFTYMDEPADKGQDYALNTSQSPIQLPDDGQISVNVTDTSNTNGLIPGHAVLRWDLSDLNYTRLEVPDVAFQIDGSNCIDRNSAGLGSLSDIAFEDGYSATNWYANHNECQDNDYVRCGCEYKREEFALKELENFSSKTADERRFEAIVTVPRPLQTNLKTPVSDPKNAFTSILYIGSYFSIDQATNGYTSSYRNAYLDSISNSTDVTFRTSDGTGDTETHSWTLTGNTDAQGHGNSLLPSVYHNLNASDNTFTFTYFPGKEHYESPDGLAYFVHDDASEARIFATIGGQGSGSTSAVKIEHRHLLSFEAGNAATSATDVKRAHADLSFEECWELTDTEASFISVGVPGECQSDGKDLPRRRVMPFVNVGNDVSENIGDGGDGDGGGDPIPGCTDDGSINFNPLADYDDGSCIECVPDTAPAEGYIVDREGIQTAPQTFEGLLPFISPALAIPKLHQGDQVSSVLEGSIYKIKGATSGRMDPDDAFSASSVPFDNTWADGNVINAFNVSTPGEDLSIGALNDPSGLYPGNTANSSQTYFRLEATSLEGSVSTAFNFVERNFYRDHYGTLGAGSTSYPMNDATATELSVKVAEALEIWAQEPAYAITCTIFSIEDWNNYANIPYQDLNNNGWAVDSYSYSFGGSQGSTSFDGASNVYRDDVGDFRGIGLDSGTPIVTLQNERTGSWNFGYRFTNTNSGTITPTDIGIEAGKQYVAVLRFTPTRSCKTQGKNTHYYWAYNFWVKYCACLDENSINVGYGNPNQNYLDDAGIVAPWVDSPWSSTGQFGLQYFPAASNLPSAFFAGDPITPGLWPGSDTFSEYTNFCAGTTGSIQARINPTRSISADRLCADPEPDSTIDCAGFASWCLSEIQPLCNFDEGGLNPYGTVDVTVLIDGFYTQSETDGWALQPVYSGQTTVNGEVYYYKIDVKLNGELYDTYYSHLFDNVEWTQNPDIVYTQSGDPLNFVGEIAELNLTNLEWTDIVDGNLAPLNLTVELTFLGILNTNTNIIDYGNPSWVTDAQGNYIQECGPWILTYEAELDCKPNVAGCTDPFAVNYNAEATVDDGTCEYRDCEGLFDSFANSIYITDIEVTPDELNCVEITDGGVTINIYQNQNSGTMRITTQDFSANVLGVNNSDPIPNFTICVLRLDSGAANLLNVALGSYSTLAGDGAIDAMSPGTTLAVGAGLNGFFLKPGGTISTVTSTESQTNPAGLEGTQYVTDVPVGALTSDLDGLLRAGQYLVFVIPDIDTTTEGSDLSVCDDVFLTFADESTFITVGTTLGDDECPEPCNQFVDQEDCPTAIPGCTNPTADNYNPEATIDDGSCEFCTICDPCILYPLDPECYTCDKGQGSQDPRGFVGAGSRLRECDGETVDCCTDPTACNYDPTCEAGRDTLREYDCGQGPGECEGAETDCDDEEPTCPDPSNPDCDGDPIGNCIDDGDCNCVGTQCNEDCIFEENGCEDPPLDPNDPVEDDFTTTTAICIPASGPGADMSVQFQDGTVADNLGEAAAMCSGYQGDKMLMKIKTGVEYDDTDLLKLSLINYLLTKAVTTQLDCILDCDNYVSGVTTGGKILGHTTRHRGAIDCSAKWRSKGNQYFAGSSSYKKGTVVRYIRNVNGKMVGSYFIARNDWRPGMDVPGTLRNRDARSWEPCINVKLQSGGNPENYYQTFYEFINRYCTSCTIKLSDDNREQEVSNKFSPSRSFQTGFEDENGNEIIF